MCDYSLEMYQSRIATAGERYVLHRFRSGTLGFIDPADCSTAVCMPAGARMRLKGIGLRVQQAQGLGPTAAVVMVRHQHSRHAHRDGVRLADGREVLLQNLNPGVSAVLLPRDLEAVFDLNPSEVAGLGSATTAPPIIAPAFERFRRLLAHLHVRPIAWGGRPRSVTAQALGTIDA